MTDRRTKVAIACQGGGSQTAFTAGALQRILRDPGFDRDVELVALSGTSGGAVCCLLAWYGLLGPPEDGERGARAADLLARFWQQNSAQDPLDLLVTNPFIVGVHRLVDAGWIPAGSPWPGVPAQVQGRLRDLLTELVDFDRLPPLLEAHPQHPTLLCGAVDVLSGDFAVFEEACPDAGWRRSRFGATPESVSVDTVLASAAVPPLLPAVQIGAGAYWDGLFAHNPPIRDLVDRDLPMRPDEVWVIQIDPEGIDRLPPTVVGTVDRRFELSSNLSLNAELHWIRQVNQWIDQGVLDGAHFKTIEVARIPMSGPLARSLDLASKVDRDPAYLRRLMSDGEQQATAFLADRSDRASPWWERRFPHRYRPA